MGHCGEVLRFETGGNVPRQLAVPPLGKGGLQSGGLDGLDAVSYTHLTLPTSDLVEISVVAVSLNKKTREQVEVEAHS